MKDDLIALLEAVRLVRAELDAYRAQQHKDAERSVARLTAIMDQPNVRQAIGTLDPVGEAPSIAPGMPHGTRVN